MEAAPRTDTSPHGYLPSVAFQVRKESHQITLYEYKVLLIKNSNPDALSKTDHTILFRRPSEVFYLYIEQVQFRPDFHFLDSNQNFYACLSHLELNSNLILLIRTLEARVVSIHYLLDEVEKFSKFESVSLYPDNHHQPI